MSDPRSTRTRDALIGAITAALDDGGADLPTITELCSAAGVSRPTFYQHFGDIPSLVSEAALAQVESLFADVSYDPAVDGWQGVLRDTVGSLLRGLTLRRTFFRRVLAGSTAHVAQEKVIDYLTGRLLTHSPLSEAQTPGAGGRARQTATFLAAGTTWLLTSWILEDASPDSVDDMATQIAALLSAGALPTRASAHD